ncbi:1,4-alpha-glucan branching enzyme, partial [Streptomyces sp. NPDC051684]
MTVNATADPLLHRRAGPGPGLDQGARTALLGGTHHDPHAVLGAHPVAQGVIVRCLLPYALGVSVLAGDTAWELPDTGDGLFEGGLPGTTVHDYRLRVTTADSVFEADDPYRFLPTLGELDLHLIGEGRHEGLWTALGAHVMEHQGVPGTRFAVWAPNARGVRMVGDFNSLNGTATPMRSLGRSGVWELFVPGIGEGELYKFEIVGPDGVARQHADPMARRSEKPPATASIVDVAHHTWGDDAWLERRAARPVHAAPFSAYEVHLPSWRPGLSYRQLAEQLPAYVS